MPSGYLPHNNPLEFERAIKRATRALRPLRSEFDTIFVTGLSGMIPGAVIAHAWKKNLVVMRKPNEDSHGCFIEGYFGRSVVILDDFVSSGDTMVRMFDYLRDYQGGRKIVGVVLYGSLSRAFPVRGHGILYAEGRRPHTLFQLRRQEAA